MAELFPEPSGRVEDILAAQMTARASAGDDAGITFVAFTATPKTKTMELFGTRPDPSRKPADAERIGQPPPTGAERPPTVALLRPSDPTERPRIR